MRRRRKTGAREPPSGSDAERTSDDGSEASSGSGEAERPPAAVYKPTRSFPAFLASVSTAFVSVLAFPLFFYLLLHGMRRIVELTPEELAAVEAARSDPWQNVPNLMPEGLEMGPDGKLVWESPEWKERRVEMRDAGEKVRLFPEPDDTAWVAVTEKRFLKSARRFLSREFSIELWTRLVEDMAKDEEAARRRAAGS